MPLLFNFAPRFDYRVVEIAWLPKTPVEWAVFTAARREAASLWNRMVRIHARIRRAGWKWPTPKQWDRWSRGRFTNIAAQSVHQIIIDFDEAVYAATNARKTYQKIPSKYPWRLAEHRNVTYTNQIAVIRGGMLRLSHGSGGSLPLLIRVPRDLPGRLVEASLAYGRIRLTCEMRECQPSQRGPLVGVDVGVNTMLAATDGVTAVLVSGRGAKAIVQYRNKSHAALASRIDRCKQGSKRHKRLARARHRMNERCARKIKDTLHKATRAVADAFPNSPVVVGKPFNAAARKMGRVQAQQVSQASTAKLIAQLAYKMAGAREVPEPYSSQTCPGCGCRQKCRRVYKCKECGLTAPRDVVGAVNIRSIGMHGEMKPNQPVPTRIKFVRPLRKYSGPGTKVSEPDSSRGALARDGDVACSSLPLGGPRNPARKRVKAHTVHTCEEYHTVRIPVSVRQRLMRARVALSMRKLAGQPNFDGMSKINIVGTVLVGLEMLERKLGLDPNAPVPPEGEAKQDEVEE